MNWRRWLPAVLIAFALIPSALLAWRFRAMPHFGRLHDDAVYLVTAKSLAAGQGYRLLNLPGEPPQTKYPPGYPAYLAIVWKLAPEFPGNLPWFTLASWVWLPALLTLTWKVFVRWEIPAAVRTVLLAFGALSVYLTTFATTLFSELPFTVLLLAVLLMVEDAGAGRRRHLWIVAGLVGGAAFLVRSAALPLLVAVPAAVRIRRNHWRGLIFTATMFPAAAWWMWWSSVHRIPPTDYVVVYYTDYFRDFLVSVDVSNFHIFLWRNVDAWMSALGSSVLLPRADKGIAMRTVLYVIAALAMAGTVRFCLSRRSALLYGLFAGLYLVMAVLWCYPPDERFVIPVFPLFLAGFWWEIRRIAVPIRARPWRHPEGAIGRMVLAGAAAVALWHVAAAWADMPRLMSAREKPARDNAACFDTMRTAAPGDGAVLSRLDGNVYLHTGKAAFAPFLPSRLVYEEREEERTRLLGNPAVFMKTYPARYAFHNPEFDGDDQAIEKAWSANPRMEQIATCGKARLWRFR